MARLTADQWERARAAYEVRGASLKEIAKRFGVSVAVLSRRGGAEGWTRGQWRALAERKADAVRELAEVERESETLSAPCREALEEAVRERTETECALARFDQALIQRGLELLEGVEEPAQWEILTRGRRNLHPDRERQGTTVNVSQQQAQQARQTVLTPKEALAEIRGEDHGHLTDA